MRTVIIRLAVLAALLAVTASGQIAFDRSAGVYTNNAGSFTVRTPFTVGGGVNRALFIVVTTQGTTDHVASVKFNSAAATRVSSYIPLGTQNTSAYLYYLASPSVGTFDITVQYTSVYISTAVLAASYTGVSQVSPSSFARSSAVTSGASDLVTTLTTPAPNCWVLLMGIDTLGGALFSGLNNPLIRTRPANLLLADSGAAVPQPGSVSYGFHSLGSNTLYSMIVAIEPASASATPTQPWVIVARNRTAP